MDSQRAWEQYTFWFSYHLNHVHFQRKDRHVHRRPWPHCDECTNALDRTKFDDKTGRFGLRSKYTRESATKMILPSHSFSCNLYPTSKILEKQNALTNVSEILLLTFDASNTQVTQLYVHGA
ncbi:hypothetical protein OS493_004240 [Desmophyllum pertusum]|uniref:Uncharacterized protein n=1 Tax=Desmophyllum pertusum TaxID=174260 RepID=A0A9W9ZWH2_9CNID|nr:hypothetical protein OS493_004240 [Desmophyllum pertusum]